MSRSKCCVSSCSSTTNKGDAATAGVPIVADSGRSSAPVDLSPTVADSGRSSPPVPAQVPDTATVAVPEDWSTEWLETEDLSEAVTDTADTENLSETVTYTADTENFSWQTAVIVPIETDDNADMEVIENTAVSDKVTIDMTIDCGDVGLESDKCAKEGSEQNAVRSNMMLHEGFQCNACKGEIVRFRYTCVQCADFDLCAACEARAQHDHHYVLRVPGPRPHEEVQGMVARVRSALRLGAPPERVTADNVTVKSEEEESPWHVDWLQDDPLPSSPVVPTVPVTEVTSPPNNQTPHETSPKTLLKKSVLRSRPAKRKLSRHQSDTSSDDTDSDDSHQAVQSSETQLNLQTIQSSRIYQTVVVRKDSKGPQTKSSELEEVETQIEVKLPERLATERQYHPVVRKKRTSMESEENEESDYSGDDENYVPNVSESARRVITVKRDGRLIRLMPVQMKRGNVVTRAHCSNDMVP